MLFFNNIGEYSATNFSGSVVKTGTGVAAVGIWAIIIKQNSTLFSFLLFVKLAL